MPRHNTDAPEPARRHAWQFHIRLDPADGARLETRAQELGISVTSLLRLLIRQGLADPASR